LNMQSKSTAQLVLREKKSMAVELVRSHFHEYPLKGGGKSEEEDYRERQVDRAQNGGRKHGPASTPMCQRKGKPASEEVKKEAKKKPKQSVSQKPRIGTPASPTKTQGGTGEEEIEKKKLKTPKGTHKTEKKLHGFSKTDPLAQLGKHQNKTKEIRQSQ